MAKANWDKVLFTLNDSLGVSKLISNAYRYSLTTKEIQMETTYMCR